MWTVATIYLAFGLVCTLVKRRKSLELDWQFRNFRDLALEMIFGSLLWPYIFFDSRKT